MDKIDIISLQIVKEYSLSTQYNTKLSSPSDASDIFRQFIGTRSEEHLVLACLNNHNYINSMAIISKGSLNSSIVHPREVFKYALLANAAGIIIAHNHPSLTDLHPSQEDISITKRLCEAGKILGIELLDHIIVNDFDFVSLKQLGIL